MGRSTGRIATFLALVAAAAALGACTTDSGVVAKSSPKGSLKWSLEQEGDNHFLGVETKANGAFGYLLVHRDLYPPFRWETTVGRFDDSPPGGVARYATELDVEGSEPLQFWLMGADPSGDGYNVFGANWQHTGLNGQTYFANTRTVDLAIEHDGADVTFYARKTGDAEWTEIWSTSAAGALMPVRPAVGVQGLTRGTLAGFDDFRVAMSTPPAEMPTESYGTVLKLYAATDALVAAMHLADGSTPDAPGALAQVNQALAQLDGAITDLSYTPPSKKAASGPAAALKLIRKARKSAASVAKQLEKGKAGKSVIKKLMKAVQPSLAAADAL